MIPISTNKKIITFLTFIGFFIIVIVFYSYGNYGTKIVDNKEKLSVQQSYYNERLFTVAMLKKDDSERTVLVTFFETPQIFQFILNTPQDVETYKILETSQQKKLPVNIRFTSSSDKNTINIALPATNNQIDNYNLEKSHLKTATPVTKPINPPVQ